MINGLALLAFAVLVSLGTWQVVRRTWKLDLIDRIEARIHASAAPAPSRDRWPEVTAASDEYRHVRATGTLVDERTTFVQAVTELGGGFWAITPLRRNDGSTVLVNRGFVPAERRDPSSWRPHPQEVTVTGLLRISEPHGGFLRTNDPAADRWFSRDVAAIAAARRLTDVAPYFIDTEKEPDETGYPVAGLTVVAFHNNHLVYALTWYALALMVVGWAAFANGWTLNGKRSVWR